MQDEIWQKAEREKELVRQEHQNRINDRRDAFCQVIGDGLLLRKAEEIRCCCDLIESRTTDSSYLEKTRIAREIADWIDPTTDYVDALLSEKMDVSDIIRLMEKCDDK